MDLAATLELLRERLEPTAQANKAMLQIECPRGLAIRGDAHAVRSAVENVAANALEALQSLGGGGKLALRAERRDGAVELLVAGQRSRHPQPVLNALFSPFSSGHGSTGLGLPIARALARAGGGDLVCTDAGPGRTTFRFTFQAA